MFTIQCCFIYLSVKTPTWLYNILDIDIYIYIYIYQVTILKLYHYHYCISCIYILMYIKYIYIYFHCIDLCLLHKTHIFLPLSLPIPSLMKSDNLLIHLRRNATKSSTPPHYHTPHYHTPDSHYATTTP